MNGEAAVEQTFDKKIKNFFQFLVDTLTIL